MRRLGQNLGCDADLYVLGEEDDAHVRMAAADLVRRLDPLVSLGRRHADVDDGQIGLAAVDRREQLVAGRRLRDDIDPLAAHEGHDALPQQRAVVGDHDAHESSAVTTVPSPGGLRTRSVPLSAATRSARPWSPVPADSSAPPTPSSAISIATTPFRRATRIEALVAFAYFATFASASQATKYAASCTGSGRRSAPAHETLAGTGERDARDSSAAFSPWLSTAGWMPRASSRTPSSERESPPPAELTSRSARSGSVRMWRSIIRSCSATDTSRCCAPSWRSRSSRLRSVSPAATRRSREARSAVSRSSDSACSRTSSSAIAAVAATAPTSSGSSSSDAS